MLAPLKLFCLHLKFSLAFLVSIQKKKKKKKKWNNFKICKIGRPFDTDTVHKKLNKSIRLRHRMFYHIYPKIWTSPFDSDIEFFHHIFPKIWTSQFNSNTELFTTFNANIWLRHRNFLLLNKSIWLRHRILFTISIAPDKALFLTKCCWYFSYFSTKTYIVGTHQKCLPRHKKYMLWLPFKSILPRHFLWIP